MSIVNLVEENTAHPIVRRVFEDIKATKKLDRVPKFFHRDPYSMKPIGKIHGTRLVHRAAQSLGALRNARVDRPTRGGFFLAP